MPAARDVQPTSSAGPPRAVLAVAWVAVVQAVALTVFGVDVLVRSLRGDRSSVGSAALLVLLVLGWAVALVLAARALRVGRRAARAPLVLSELLLLVVGVPLVQGDAARWWGLVLVVTAGVGVLAVLSPAVTAWTTAPDN